MRCSTRLASPPLRLPVLMFHPFKRPLPAALLSIFSPRLSASCSCPMTATATWPAPFRPRWMTLARRRSALPPPASARWPRRSTPQPQDEQQREQQLQLQQEQWKGCWKARRWNPPAPLMPTSLLGRMRFGKNSGPAAAALWIITCVALLPGSSPFALHLPTPRTCPTRPCPFSAGRARCAMCR